MPTAQIQPQIPTQTELNAPGAMNTVGGGMMSAIPSNPIVATSNPSRIDTGLNSAKLDTELAKQKENERIVQEQKTAMGDGNLGYGIGVDGKPIQKEATGPAKEATQPLEAGRKWAYLPDGTRIQIPITDDPTKYGASGTSTAKPETAYGPDGKPTTPVSSSVGADGKPLNPYEKEQRDALELKQKDAEEAKAALDKATSMDDPEMKAVIESINATIDARLAKMQDANNRMLEGKRIAGISAGRQRYAPGMEQGLLSTEEMDGIARLTELEASRKSLILQAVQARKAGAMKEFNDTMEQVQKNYDDKVNMVKQLYQYSMDADKALNEKKKEERQAVLDQTRLSDSIAPVALQAYQGLKTPADKTAFIAKLAEKYQLPAEMIQSSMLAYSDESTKTSLEQDMKQEQINTEKAQQANYYSQISERKEGTTGGKKFTDGKLTYTESEVSAYKSLLQSGGVVDGVEYNPSGSNDGYADPYLYKALYDKWIENGGTKAGFLKQFDPNSFVNPEATNLPAFLMPTE